MDVLRKISQENGPKAERDKTERATGLGRRTREEIYYIILYYIILYYHIILYYII